MINAIGLDCMCNFTHGFLLLDLQDVVMLNGFGTIVNSLGKRVKPYLPQICGTILFRLNNKAAKVRQMLNLKVN